MENFKNVDPKLVNVYWDDGRTIRCHGSSA